ncbi:MAG: Nif3-like dinuclear metal center hexameric protein [Bacteroidota bacterium]
MMAQLGWKDQRSANDAFVYELEQQSLSDLAKALKKLWNTESIKVVGPADMSFTKVGFAAGAVGYQAHLDMLRRDDVEVLMIGEVNEWETVEYVRDAISQGRKKALILTGHANSEEAGMAYCAEWMKAFVKEVPVELVAAGDPFWAP